MTACIFHLAYILMFKSRTGAAVKFLNASEEFLLCHAAWVFSSQIYNAAGQKLHPTLPKDSAGTKTGWLGHLPQPGRLDCCLNNNKSNHRASPLHPFDIHKTHVTLYRTLCRLLFWQFSKASRVYQQKHKYVKEWIWCSKWNGLLEHWFGFFLVLLSWFWTITLHYIQSTWN